MSLTKITRPWELEGICLLVDAYECSGRLFVDGIVYSILRHGMRDVIYVACSRSPETIQKRFQMDNSRLKVLDLFTDPAGFRRNTSCSSHVTYATLVSTLEQHLSLSTSPSNMPITVIEDATRCFYRSGELLWPENSDNSLISLLSIYKESANPLFMLLHEDCLPEHVLPLIQNFVRHAFRIIPSGDSGATDEDRKVVCQWDKGGKRPHMQRFMMNLSVHPPYLKAVHPVGKEDVPGTQPVPSSGVPEVSTESSLPSSTFRLDLSAKEKQAKERGDRAPFRTGFVLTGSATDDINCMLQEGRLNFPEDKTNAKIWNFNEVYKEGTVPDTFFRQSSSG
ncbi:unnamed protein product [Cyprideis torosa]|uniref:Uncharacterized protein n=1 Tax=Cyprideis torosa TaxID=163714 RepID=A0A7R8W1R4_9CRUS|nr:unnamed protein product [Cyprideis torosa]CAG0880075.1 unnamed protein product [Cyprideis torosa]